MKTVIYIIIAAALLPSPATAQNGLEEALASVERNNTTLKALREEVDARKLYDRSCVALPDPEIGFGYLWGSPSSTGRRTDLSVTQRLDVATITGMKSRVADSRNLLAETAYDAGRAALFAETRRLYIELIYGNIRLRELEVRTDRASAVAKHYRRRLDEGDATRLELNRAQIGLASLRNRQSRAESDRNALSASLAQLNGGEKIEVAETFYPSAKLPDDFDEWFARVARRSPALVGAGREADASRGELSLSRASLWPSLTAGYMSEQAAGQRYGGVTAGLSIPLWQNTNRVKHARAAVRAAESRLDDLRTQLHSRLAILHTRGAELRRCLDESLQAMAETDDEPLLRRALYAGAISLTEYLAALTLRYEALDQLMETERDYHLTVAELLAAGL
jgi:outer membrane protein TolC